MEEYIKILDQPFHVIGQFCTYSYYIIDIKGVNRDRDVLFKQLLAEVILKWLLCGVNLIVSCRNISSVFTPIEELMGNSL